MTPGGVNKGTILSRSEECIDILDENGLLYKFFMENRFGKFSVHIFTRCCMVAPLLNRLLLLLLLPFLLLLNHLVTSITTFTK